MNLRSSLAAGLVAVVAVSLATARLADRSASTPSVDADLARHHGRAHRPLVPRSARRASPRPTEEPGHQSASSRGAGKHIEGSVTERHVVHGSGSITVTSGAVDEGSGGSDADASHTGPRIRPRRR